MLQSSSLCPKQLSELAFPNPARFNSYLTCGSNVSRRNTNFSVINVGVVETIVVCKELFEIPTKFNCSGIINKTYFETSHRSFVL